MSGKEMKLFIKYIGLSVLGTVGVSCYILADTYFISKGMGTAGLAALNICIPAYSIVYGIGLMFGVGGATKYNILKERGIPDAGKSTFTNTVIVGLSVSAVFFICGAFFAKPLAELLGARGEVVEMSRIYLKVLLMFAPAFILNAIFYSFLRNDGSPTLAMTGMIAGSLSNILLDWIFIFPLDMGIFGAILATGLSPVISLSIYMPKFLMKRNGFGIGRTKMDFLLCGKMALTGVPVMLGEMSTAVVTFTFNKIMYGFEGTVGVAAYGVIANIAVVVLAVFNGISNGVQPLISKNYAEENGKNVRKLLAYASGVTVLFGAAVYLSAYFGAEGLASVFNGEKNITLQLLAERGIRIYFIGAFFVGINILLTSYFAAREKIIQSHIISASRGLAVILPAAVFMSSIYGTDGLWLSFPLTEFIVTVCGTVLAAVEIKRNQKRKNVVLTR